MAALNLKSAEEFHSTPETQTDESYNHPEDLEHFAQHEAIELKEAEKEAKFQGITVEEALKQHEPPEEGEATPPPPETDPQFVAQPGGAEAPKVDDPSEPKMPPNPKVTRVTPPEKQEPKLKFKDATKQRGSQEEWGAGSEGYKSPTTPSEKMRKNLPYKVNPFPSVFIQIF